MRESGAIGVTVNAFDQVIASGIPDQPAGAVLFCGNPRLVRAQKKKLFLAGMVPRDIHSPAFLAAV